MGIGENIWPRISWEWERTKGEAKKRILKLILALWRVMHEKYVDDDATNTAANERLAAGE